MDAKPADANVIDAKEILSEKEEQERIDKDINMIKKFYKCDFRVGEIEECMEQTGYKGLYKIFVNLGEHLVDGEI